MDGQPSIQVHAQPDRPTCLKVATQVYKSVRAGSVRVWCQKVIVKEIP
jgi:hypothetical protein